MRKDMRKAVCASLRFMSVVLAVVRIIIIIIALVLVTLFELH